MDPCEQRIVTHFKNTDIFRRSALFMDLDGLLREFLIYGIHRQRRDVVGTLKALILERVFQLALRHACTTRQQNDQTNRQPLV